MAGRPPPPTLISSPQ
jgi:hypothetical protein